MTVEEIFNRAIEQGSVPQREAFLAQALQRHPEHRTEVEELIRAHDNAGSFLAHPIVDLEVTGSADATGNWADSKAPSQVGPYRLLQLLGQGGMGSVYLAEQTHPVRRRVALKLIKPGMDSAQVLKRFEAERQALAIMDHTNIAKVYDAGTTPGGHPYFVMELIKGIPITTYCDELSLNLRERLLLLIPVCHAIHHAHQKGIIHRDIKPSNVLIAIQDGEPVPKVIDFGVAKAAHQPLSAQTFYTEIGGIVGTLDYMSPEQAELNALDIDTRVDVFALGVLLYELLTDTTPLDRKNLKGADLASVLTQIRELAPPCPSARLSDTKHGAGSIAQRMKTDLSRLRRELRGDLDWIVMKCLEKDRTRRYDGADLLADDLNRYLRHETVVARRPSIGYRLSKFCRRRRVPLQVAAVIAAMLAIIAVVGWKYRQSSIDANRERAESKLFQSHNAALEKIDRIQGLIAQESYEDAYQMLSEVESVIPNHASLGKLRAGCSQAWTFSSDPTGAELWRREYSDPQKPWIKVTTTAEGPQSVQVPRGVFLWKATLPGFRDVVGLRLPQDAQFELDAQETLPTEMVRIPAGRATPPSQAFMYRYEEIEVPSFFIDRFEVSNVEFAAFVLAGGYHDESFWQDVEFVDEKGTSLSWTQAQDILIDQSGQPGPATWKNGTFASGTEDEPVLGVSWYEAMAYARFSGKSLPTVYQWEHATQHEYFSWLTVGQILDRFHFGSEPLNRRELQDPGIFGTIATGGNAKEWTLNETGERDRFILGGGCGENLYAVITMDHHSPIRRDKNFGFRCVRTLQDQGPRWGDKIESIPWAAAPSAESLLDKKTFELVVGDRYAYDRSAPLDVRLERHDDIRWRHTSATFNAAYKNQNGDRERAEAHLYLPNTERPPDGFQTVVYLPPLDAMFLPTIRPLEMEYGLDQILKSGRAVLRPICFGAYDRKTDVDVEPEKKQIMVAQDIMRSVDFLLEQEDIDPGHIALYGFSWGSILSFPVLAIDSRFRAAIFQGAGLHIDPIRDRQVFLELAHTWPQIHIPVLMIGGKDDMCRPIEESQRPMLALLGSTDKDLTVCLGGHMLPNDVVMAKLLPWLDQRFGVPVRPGAGSSGLRRIPTSPQQ